MAVTPLRRAQVGFTKLILDSSTFDQSKPPHSISISIMADAELEEVSLSAIL